MTRALVYIVVLGVFAGAAWAYRQGFYRGAPYPRNTFLFSPGDHFMDLFNFFGPLDANDPYSYVNAVYPPFTYIVMEPFSWIGGTPSTVAWTLLYLGGVGAFVARQLDVLPPVDRWGSTAILLVVSYPFLIAFDRGNIEIVVTVLLAAFAYGLQTSRTDLAAVAIGAAAAMKGYPILFAGIFLVRGQWRPLAISAASAAMLTVLGSIYYGFDVIHTIDLLRERLHTYHDGYIIGDAGLGFGCSLWGAVKILAVDGLGGDAATVSSLEPIYTAVTAVLALGLLVALWRLPLQLWEQLTLLVVAFNVLPTVSGDYKLLHLVIPIALFLRHGVGHRWRWLILAAFAMLMIPKAYVLLRPDGLNLGVVMDPVVMLLLAVLLLVAAARRSSAAPAATLAG